MVSEPAGMMWSMLTRHGFVPEDLGVYQSPLRTFLAGSHESPVDLTSHSWFAAILNQWSERGRQHDVAEFTGFLVEQMRLDIPQNWERRFQTENGLQTPDFCRQFQPISFQLHPTQPDDHHVRMQDLIDNWMNTHGMQTALVECPDLVCVHIDRFYHLDDSDSLGKLQHSVGFWPGCFLPTFDFHGDILSTKHSYLVAAAVAHIGGTLSIGYWS